MRLVGKLLGLLVLLLVVVAVAGFALSSSKIGRKFALDTRIPRIPTDPASVERGRHLVRAIGKCVGCHGDSLGGTDFIDGGPLGHIWAPNLTRGKGGFGASLTDAQMVNAIRRGLKPDGTSLLLMPSPEFQRFSDEDLGALIAYVRSVPPVDHEWPQSYLGPLGRALYLAGQFRLSAEDVDHTSYPPATITPSATAEYGEYLANVGGCTGCHGPGLSGGHVPGTPAEFKPASNLTPTGIGHYTEADFVTALRTGVRPGGTQIDKFMPWELAREMTDDEIRAVFAYLKTVPPKPFGDR